MESSSNRKKQYDLLSEVARDLINEIYNNEEGFIRVEYVETFEKMLIKSDQIHPLEPYVISYDDNMENEGIIISIGSRVGFNIKYDPYDAYEPAVQFYDRCSYTIRHNYSNRIYEIMNMTEDDFKKELSKHGYKYILELYLDRLNIDSHRYDRNLIRSYYEDEPFEETTDISDNIKIEI
jgi:hypothetical protein